MKHAEIIINGTRNSISITDELTTTKLKQCGEVLADTLKCTRVEVVVDDLVLFSKYTR